MRGCIVADVYGEVALDVRYLNPNTMRVRGKFHHPGYPPLIVQDESVAIGGYEPFVGSIAGDNGGALFSFNIKK